MKAGAAAGRRKADYFRTVRGQDVAFVGSPGSGTPVGGHPALQAALARSLSREPEHMAEYRRLTRAYIDVMRKYDEIAHAHALLGHNRKSPEKAALAAASEEWGRVSAERIAHIEKYGIKELVVNDDEYKKYVQEQRDLAPLRAAEIAKAREKARDASRAKEETKAAKTRAKLGMAPISERRTYDASSVVKISALTREGNELLRDKVQLVADVRSALPRKMQDHLDAQGARWIVAHEVGDVDSSSRGAAGVYMVAHRKIVTGLSSSYGKFTDAFVKNVAAHEASHAYDYTRVYGKFSDTPEFRSAWNKGLERAHALPETDWRRRTVAYYIGDAAIGTPGGSSVRVNQGREETFAELGAFHLGFPDERGKILHKYFPEASELIKEHLESLK